MNQADRDAEIWMQQHLRNQERELYRAKELGYLHHINQFGEVVIEKPKEETK
jgi:hypothetical protein